MQISPAQKDALGEIINIGFGRSASALSTLVSRRVIIDAPEVNLFPVAELENALYNLSEREIINVHQVFRGKLAGDAMLLMDTESGTILVDMLSGGAGVAHHMSASDREALVEAGNILLNAFIGSFGNLLKVHITFTVPHLQIESLQDMMNTLSIGEEGVEYALVVKIQFRLIQGDVSGYVLIVMGIQSLEVLFQAMEDEGFIL